MERDGADDASSPPGVSEAKADDSTAAAGRGGGELMKFMMSRGVAVSNMQRAFMMAELLPSSLEAAVIGEGNRRRRGREVRWP